MLRVETWSEFVRRVSHPLTQTQIAEKSGVAQTNIGRWLRGDPGQPRAEYVVQFARAFDQPPIIALVAAGYLTVEEAGAQPQVRTPLREYGDDELLAEVQKRLISR